MELSNDPVEVILSKVDDLNELDRLYNIFKYKYNITYIYKIRRQELIHKMVERLAKVFALLNHMALVPDYSLDIHGESFDLFGVEFPLLNEYYLKYIKLGSTFFTYENKNIMGLLHFLEDPMNTMNGFQFTGNVNKMMEFEDGGSNPYQIHMVYGPMDLVTLINVLYKMDGLFTENSEIIRAYEQQILNKFDYFKRKFRL